MRAIARVTVRNRMHPQHKEEGRMRSRGARAWVRTVLALAALATATATARAEQIADRFDQARLEGVVVVYAATDLDVVRRTIRACDLGRLRTAAPALLRARSRGGIERWLTANTATR